MGILSIGGLLATGSVGRAEGSGQGFRAMRDPRQCSHASASTAVSDSCPKFAMRSSDIMFRSGARSFVYRSKYNDCLMSRPNSRGSFRPLFPATWAMSRTMSCILDSSTAMSVLLSKVFPSEEMSFWMSAAKASSSTSPTVAPMEMSALAIPRASLTASAVFSLSMPVAICGERRPTMPKSMKPTRPSSRTSRFPAWTSAWKNSHF
mmetsp:Transcript_73820/g.173200  ORF Transcript_73820/g.173200 Transcript_73820/m.173200 type:complete len:206 (+) Transcript_73820:213-830(+)